MRSMARSSKTVRLISESGLPGSAAQREYKKGSVKVDLCLQPLRQIAAVDGDELAGDVGGIGQGEESGHAGNVSRLGQSPQRGRRDQILFKAAFSKTFFTISVRVNQGKTPLTRMPAGPHSTARERVR
jgi:hypothetical protein